MPTGGPQRPNPLQWPLTPQGLDGLDATIEDIYRELRRLRSAVGGTGHDILSDTHTDTLVATAQDGDIIIRSGGTWQRLAKATDGWFLQLVAGLPAWGVDGTLLENLNAAELYGTIPTAAMIHNLLSAAHPDTDPASVVLGDTIVGQGIGDTDAQKYWFEGEPLDELADTTTAGAQLFWIDGLPTIVLSTPLEVKWARKAIGAAGTQPVSNGSGWEWQDVAAVEPVWASLYKASDVAIASSTSQDLLLDGIVFDGYSYQSSDRRYVSIPSGRAGVYLVVGQIQFESPFFGSGWIALVKNGVTIATVNLEAADGVSERAAVGSSWLGMLAVGDLISLNAAFLSPTGVASVVEGGTNKTFLQLLKV